MTLPKPLSDAELEDLVASDHRLIARLARELLETRRALKEIIKRRPRDVSGPDAKPDQ